MDPFTIAALIKAGGSLASGVASNIGAKDQIQKDKDRAQGALDQANLLREAALDRRKQYGLGPSYTQLKSMVMQDPASDYLRQQAQRQEASSLGALSSAGARAALGGVQATARASQDRLAKIAADEQLRRQQGLQIVGEAEQRVARTKLDDARTDLDLGRARQEQAQGALFGAQDADRLRKQALAQSAIGVGETVGMGIAGRDGKFDGLDASLLNMLNAKNGAILRGKTPGDFSHEDNPIDIVQDGEKIGEMTGGEGIVSPEDLGKLEQLAGDGKSPLHSFVKELIRKLEKNGSE
jgi:hypothetical protein